MKDIHIKAIQIRKEIIIWAVCLAASIGLNIYSIAKYETDWSELIGQLHIVLMISLLIYFLVVIFRLMVHAILRIGKIKK